MVNSFQSARRDTAVDSIVAPYRIKLEVFCGADFALTSRAARPGLRQRACDGNQ